MVIKEDRKFFRRMRKAKEITLKEIANYIKCSIALLSKYETNNCGMSDEKENAYKAFIKNHE